MDNPYGSIGIKTLFLKNKLLVKLTPGKKRLFQQDLEQSQVYPGDSVRVRSREIIMNLLDNRGAYKGCDFMEEMYEQTQYPRRSSQIDPGGVC